MSYVQEATLKNDLSSSQSEWYSNQERFSCYFCTDAMQWMEQRSVILRNAKLKLAKSQDCYANAVNKHQKDEKTAIGEKNILDSRNLGFPIEVSAKRSVRWIRSFLVKKIIYQDV